MKVPTMMEKLLGILLNFQTNSYAYSTDNIKTFLRIGLHKILILQQSLIDLPQFPGAISSPFLLQATIEYCLRL